ncbi:MAG: response regulator [Candidatus Omnitrophica bacterium]|nr:response regulator [Candidatus Omnitrophota bacterium]
MNSRILIVDAQKEQAQLLKDILESADFGYQCRLADSLEQVKDRLRAKNIDVMLVDHALPEERLYEKLQRLKLKNRAVRMIMLADEISPEEAVKARDHFMEGFCSKSEDYPALINTIEQVIE